MAQRTSLLLNQSGFVHPRQLWLVGEPGDGTPKHLYVVASFIGRSEAKPGMLRVTHKPRTSAQGSYYAILLPPPEQFTVAHTLRHAGSAQREMIRIRQVLVMGRPGEDPFATIPDFYFTGT